MDAGDHLAAAIHFVASCHGCGARSEKICAEELPLARADARARLEELDLKGEHWQVPESFVGEGSTLLAATREGAAP